jgi:caa(3)-type oxidase subunit IV
MADKKGKGGAKKASEKKAEQAPAEAEKKAETKAESKADDHGDHGHARAADAHAHGDPHAHKPNIREYLVIFAVLAILTVLEVAVAKIPGLSKKLLGIALIGLALTKAGIVGLYYMHLKHETKVLKLTVALPMAAPTIYALVLISEAAWRLMR